MKSVDENVVVDKNWIKLPGLRAKDSKVYINVEALKALNAL